MGTVMDHLKSVLPGVYVHSIYLGSSDGSDADADRKASYFGNVNKQVRTANNYGDIHAF
jgi:hypothetical protein